MKRTTLPQLLRALILLSWPALFLLLLQRDYFIKSLEPADLEAVQIAKTEEYQSILFNQRKIGYVANRFTPIAEGLLHIDQQARMRLNIGATVHEIEIDMQAKITGDNRLQDFSFTFTSPFYQMQAKGQVTGNRVDYQLSTGHNDIHDHIDFISPPRLPTSRRAYLLGLELKAGDKRKIPWFDPVSLAGKESVIEYFGVESVFINNRVEKLHLFTESFAGSRVRFWLNDRGTVVKEESPAGFVFQREPKFRAMALDEPVDDILQAVAVKPLSGPPQLTDTTMRYRLILPSLEGFELDGGRQQLTGDILTVVQEQLPAEPAAARCETPSTATAATPYIQSDHPDIVAQAREIVGEETNLANKTLLIANWVYQNLQKRPVVGVPDALTTLASRQGDCNEHASLFAALARAAGVPARIAIGLTAMGEGFYYHAWNEVCLGGSWISLDTTVNQLPADLGHIRFLTGGIQEQVKISALLGQLQLDVLPAMP